MKEQKRLIKKKNEKIEKVGSGEPLDEYITKRERVRDEACHVSNSATDAADAAAVAAADVDWQVERVLQPPDSATFDADFHLARR